MNDKSGGEPRDPLLRDSFKALLLAAERAREEAVRTGTDLIVVRDGQIVRHSPSDILAGASNPAEAGPPLSPSEIERRLDEGRALAERGMVDAALLITWAAVEAAMRRLLPSDRTGMPRLLVPRALISTLYRDGLIGRREYDLLKQGSDIRNRVAHGFSDAKATPELVQRLARVAQNLLTEAPAARE